MRDKKIIAFVHAKGTSVRVKSKNMKTLGGKPLFCHAIENAINSKLVSEVVIDSENDTILSIGKEHGATTLKRPQKLASNETSGDDLAYWQASNFKNSFIVLQVVPTAPFLRPESIDAAILLLENSSADSVAAVYEEAFYEWKNGTPAYYDESGRIPNSNMLKKITYETTGLYINKTKYVLENRKRLNPMNCLPYLLSKIESVDINTEEDFEFARILWRGLNSKL